MKKSERKSQKNWLLFFICSNPGASYSASNGIKIRRKYESWKEKNDTFFINSVLYAQSKKTTW